MENGRRQNRLIIANHKSYQRAIQIDLGAWSLLCGALMKGNMIRQENNEESK